MYLTKFTKFLESVDLATYRDKYRPIKIVEMDMPKEVQAIGLLYKVYWAEKRFIDFESFYKEYLNTYKAEIERFRVRTTMCEDCFYRGLPQGFIAHGRALLLKFMPDMLPNQFSEIVLWRCQPILTTQELIFRLNIVVKS